MTKVEAIKKVLEDNNGVATWEIIYRDIEKYYPAAKASEEWQSGLRGVFYREEKANRTFKRIGLGLISLIDFKADNVKNLKNDTVRMHSYMEGICVEVGNFLNFATFTADPSATYNQLPLSSIATMREIPAFTYSEIIDISKRIDVLWFNQKGFQFPKRAIEIVDSIGTLEPALKRTFQLLEMNVSFNILCKTEHVQKIEKELSLEPYVRVKNRYQVYDYDTVLEIYNNPIAHSKHNFLSVESNI